MDGKPLGDKAADFSGPIASHKDESSENVDLMLFCANIIELEFAKLIHT